MKDLLRLMTMDVPAYAQVTESELRMQAAVEEVMVRRKIAAITTKAEIASEIKRIARQYGGKP